MTKLATYVGYVDNSNATQQDTVTAEWNSLVTAVGQAPSMMLTYIDNTRQIANWTGDQQWAVNSWKATPWLAGVTPVIGVPMAITGNNADSDFKAIASGAWDVGLTGVFTDWARAGYKNFYIRPGWEMNGTWMPWSLTAANVTDFVVAFQHIANLAHSFSGAQITVVWNPNVGGATGAAVLPTASYYPGDSYADVVGIDIYGPIWGSDASPNDASGSDTKYTLREAMAFALAHGKPFAIPETGANDAIFPANLSAEVSAAGVTPDFIGLWDSNDGGAMAWSQNTTNAAAWKSAYGTISGGSGGGGVVTPETLSIVLSASNLKAKPSFIVKMDNQQIGSGTVTTHNQTLSFTQNWAAGTHVAEIDFAGLAGRRTSTLSVNQVTYAGASYLTSPHSLNTVGEKLMISVNH